MVEATGRDAAIAECRAFGRYLSGDEPTEYVVRCYLDLLPSSDVPEATRRLLIERAVMSMAHAGAVPLRIADAYARFFRPRGLLRRRLVLLLAILENSAGTERTLNSGDDGALLAIAGGLAMTLVASGLCMAAGIILLGPVHLASTLAPRGTTSAPAGV